MTKYNKADLTAKADRHLWGHFARHGAGITPPIITRGEGVHIWDIDDKRYIDGLSGLFVVQAGHGRHEIAEAGRLGVFFQKLAFLHDHQRQITDSVLLRDPKLRNLRSGLSRPGKIQRHHKRHR